MPKFYTSVILLRNHSKEIGEKQFSVFGSRWGQNSPLMHIPLYQWGFNQVLVAVMNEIFHKNVIGEFQYIFYLNFLSYAFLEKKYSRKHSRHAYLDLWCKSQVPAKKTKSLSCFETNFRDVLTPILISDGYTKEVVLPNSGTIDPDTVQPGLDVIKLKYSLKLEIKRKDWLLADTCPQAAIHSALF